MSARRRAVPQDSVPVSWSVCTRCNIGEKFSAVGYFFAKRLHDELHVPVAIIHSSWEGTSAEPWVRREALLADSELHDVAQQQIDDMLRRDEDDAKFLPKMLAWEQKYGAADPGNKGLNRRLGQDKFRRIGLEAGHDPGRLSRRWAARRRRGVVSQGCRDPGLGGRQAIRAEPGLYRRHGAGLLGRRRTRGASWGTRGGIIRMVRDFWCPANW